VAAVAVAVAVELLLPTERWSSQRSEVGRSLITELIGE